MSRLRKETNRLIKELIDLRNSRKSIDDFNSNFLINFSENSNLMHTILKQDGISKENLKVASRQYFVFLISCWETFFRDVFVYVYSEDKQTIKKLLEQMKIPENSIGKNVTLTELLSKNFNFQNLKDLEIAYSVLWGSNFLEDVCETKIEICGFNGKFVKELSICSLFPDWRNIIDKSFSTRHKVVHDANYRIDVNIDFIQKSESLFLMLPQFITHLIAKRFKLKYMVFSDGYNSGPYISTIHDILADDWVVL